MDEHAEGHCHRVAARVLADLDEGGGGSREKEEGRREKGEGELDDFITHTSTRRHTLRALSLPSLSVCLSVSLPLSLSLSLSRRLLLLLLLLT